MQEKRPGDVLIFEAGDDWVGKSIALLTNSTVSHSAMLYDQEHMVEMGSRGIGINRFVPKAGGELVHIMRRGPEVEPQPLIAAADKYVEQGIKYDYPSLVILAGLLIYRAVRPTPRWQKVTDLIIGLACLELDKLLNKLIHHKAPVAVMMCSQLVYQCYRDCGDDYSILIENGLLQQSGEGYVRLVDLLDSHNNGEELPNLASYPRKFNVEALAEELYHSLNEAKDMDSALLTPADSLQDLCSLVKKFLDLMERILETADIQIPLPALFVTPADLYENAVNVKEYDTMTIERIMGK